MNQPTAKVQNSERGTRLLEERNRLGFTQPQLAAVGGVYKGSQIFYEKGSAPTADYLSAIAGHGVDVAYILTGERSAPPVDRSMLGTTWDNFTQLRYWRIGDDAPMEQVAEVAFLSAWLRGLTHSPGECYIYSVPDDRMAPTVPQGATLMFDHSRRMPADNGLFVLRLDHGIALRRLHQLGRQWLVECDNRDYLDRTTLTAKDAADRILGPAIWYGIDLGRG